MGFSRGISAPRGQLAKPGDSGGCHSQGGGRVTPTPWAGVKAAVFTAVCGMASPPGATQPRVSAGPGLREKHPRPREEQTRRA